MVLSVCPSGCRMPARTRGRRGFPARRAHLLFLRRAWHGRHLMAGEGERVGRRQQTVFRGMSVSRCPPFDGVNQDRLAALLRPPRAGKMVGFFSFTPFSGLRLASCHD